MSKHNYLLSHLLDPDNRDEPSRLVVTPNPDRLYFRYTGEPGGWDTVASYIAGPSRWPVKWFPDANIAFLPGTDGVWDALRVAGLGSLNGSTVISGVAEHEMQEWLDDPWRNKERAEMIRTAIGAGTWLRKFRMANSTPLALAAISYTRLLGMRRFLARPTSNGPTLLGTDADDKSRTMNAIRDRIGPRAVRLARKGREDAEKGAINLSDEMHCLMAIVYALLNRTDAVILTADQDYLEIFYKAQWFFDTHYRAWLAARMVSEGRYGEPAKVLTDTDDYFQGPLTLYRRPTLQLQEVLPPDPALVHVGMLYVAPDGMLHKMAFAFEQLMLEMIIMRGKTNGRCTDLFGSANIHVDLGPLKRYTDGLYLGIGEDVSREFNIGKVRILLAHMDSVHSLHCCERFAGRSHL